MQSDVKAVKSLIEPASLIVPSHSDGLDIRGTVECLLFDKRGRLKQRELTKNLVVTSGRTMIMERLDSSPTSVPPGWMAVGTGATGVVLGDTLLVAEVARVALTSSVAAVGVLTMIGNFPAGTGTASLQEAGVFGIVTANTIPMHSRATYTTIPKGASDTLQITWTWTLTAS
jgi:hypothetical protein